MIEQGWAKVPNSIVDDQTLSAHAKLVMVALCRFADGQGLAWPSIATLAARAGISGSSVKRALGELRAGEWIAWESRRGEDSRTKIANLYQLTTHRSQGPMAIGQGDPTHRSHRPDPQVTVTPPMGQGDPVRRPIEEDPKKKTLAPAATKQQQTQNDRFDEFWDAYPRKKDKGKARAAWTKAIKIADPDTIISGAQTYAKTPFEDPKFIKYPQGWLSGERWTDEPDKPHLRAVSGESAPIDLHPWMRR